jgi:type IV secretion system protein TrbC
MRFSGVYIVLVLLLLAMASIVTPEHAWAAAGTGGGLPYEGWMGKLADSITGPYAYAISLIAFVLAGSVLIFGGDLNGFWRSLVTIILVLSFIVGVKNTLSTFFGVGAEVAAVSSGSPVAGA